MQSVLSVNRYFDLITRSLIWSIANEIDKKCGSVKSTQCFAQLKEIYQVINCHPIRPDVIDDREYRSLIIMLRSNQVWLRLSCICWELRLMPDWLPPVKGWWNLVSQSFPINKRLLVVVRVCTVSSLLYTNNLHPHDSPPTLASHWSARSADCPLIGQPHVSGSLPGGIWSSSKSGSHSVRFPVSDLGWTDWLLHLGLLSSDQQPPHYFPPTGSHWKNLLPLLSFVPRFMVRTARSDIK